jgi:hypothetical protein
MWLGIIGGFIFLSLFYVWYAVITLLQCIDIQLTEEDVEGLQQDFKNGLRNVGRNND